MSTALIGIGSNLGDAQENVRRSLELLSERPGVAVVRSSRLYRSKPVGGPHAQGDYINAAAVLETSLSPHGLLQMLQHIEAQKGRSREQRWAPRTLDLDLLLYDDKIIEDADLTLPHARMSFRRFVLDPAAEIAPDMLHPVTATRIDELLARLDRGSHYVAIGGGAYFSCFDVGDWSWLAKRLSAVLDCPLVPWASRGLPRFADESPSIPTTAILEVYERCAGTFRREFWKTIPELEPLLEGPAGITVDGSPVPPAVSSFWFEEWRLLACLDRLQKYDDPHSTHEYNRVVQTLEEVSNVIVSPKLVIWLKTTAHSGKVEEESTCCAAEMFRQSPCGPLLLLDTDDREWMLAESIAAIKAMEPLEGVVS